MAYTSDKKPGALTQASSLGDNDNLVVEQSGDVKRATIEDLEAKIFDAKTAQVSPTGTEVVVVRKTDDTLAQVALSNIVPALNITNAKISDSAAIADTKLDTISSAGKVLNSATTATSANTNNTIVARDGSGNFSAGAITANTFTANTFTGTLAGSITGSAPTLTTGRTISLTGDVTGITESFNGSADVSASTTIANDAVTNDKLASGIDASKLTTGTLPIARIANDAVTNDKLASGIDASKLTTGTLPIARIANDAVTADKLDGVADIDTKTANYTLVLADAGRVLEFNSASNLTLTVPTNATVAFATGTTIVVTRRGTGDVTVAGAGVTLRSGGSKLKIGQQYAGIALVKIGTDEWMVLGDLKS